MTIPFSSLEKPVLVDIKKDGQNVLFVMSDGATTTIPLITLKAGSNAPASLDKLDPDATNTSPDIMFNYPEKGGRVPYMATENLVGLVTINDYGAGGGIASIQYKIDDALAWSTATFTAGSEIEVNLNLAGLSVGPHSLRLKVVDVQGSEVEDVVYWSNDGDNKTGIGGSRVSAKLLEDVAITSVRVSATHLLWTYSNGTTGSINISPYGNAAASEKVLTSITLQGDTEVSPGVRSYKTLAVFSDGSTQNVKPILFRSTAPEKTAHIGFSGDNLQLQIASTTVSKVRIAVDYEYYGVMKSDSLVLTITP